MSDGNPEDPLHREHTPQAIAERLAGATQHSYLGDGVLGAIDGTITTFAIVAGASGAGLSGGIALVLGLANVLADGFSMAVGNLLKVKADRQLVDLARRIEENHIDTVPDGEREEIRQVFAQKGFEGETLEQAVEIITCDRRRWVDTMLTEELGLRLETPEPVRAACTTFFAFLVAGLVPLAPLFFWRTTAPEDMFLASSAAALVTFFVIGQVKGKLVGGSGLRSGIETLLLGGTAAGLAYAVGLWAEGLI
jgi:VIT1/CCC1 family predicted Fe2+/Mn2+ transporter